MAILERNQIIKEHNRYYWQLIISQIRKCRLNTVVLAVWEWTQLSETNWKETTDIEIIEQLNPRHILKVLKKLKKKNGWMSLAADSSAV